MTTTRLAELERAIDLIHDQIHKGNVEAAHDLLHRAAGLSDAVINTDGPHFYREFAIAFNVAARKHNVFGAYVIFEQSDPDNPRMVRVLTGGEAKSCKILDQIIAAGMAAVAEPQ